MSHRETGTPRSRAVYFELNKHEENDSRSSIKSRSPITPISERDGFDDEPRLKSTTFHADGLETFYEPIKGYEGAHRYDPEYAWSAEDEGRVVRKVCLPSTDYLQWIHSDSKLD
jgi:hypothetical protein